MTARLALFCAACIVSPGFAMASPPAPGSVQEQLLAPEAGWVSSATNGRGWRCCDMADGAVVSARQRDGHWQVHFDRDGRFNAPDEWMDVAPEAIVKGPNPLGLPIAWFVAGEVRCFSPPAGT